MEELTENAEDIAEDGEQALGILKNNHVDLLLTDIQMPNMNGIEMCEEIKKATIARKEVYWFEVHQAL